MEQNARLLGRAKDQANHKPEDVALQQELGALRIDILNRTFQSEITSQPRTFPNNMYHAQQDYSMQLMLLEQQNKRLEQSTAKPCDRSSPYAVNSCAIMSKKINYARSRSGNAMPL